MKNLEGKELKDKFFECLQIVEENNADINEVYFLFSDIEGKIDRLHLSYNFGYWEFKKVCFLYSENNRFCNINDIAKKIIVQNMPYDYFSYQDMIHNIGKVECYGHGDFWKKDTFTFYFFRFDIDKD